jgi:flagellar biosynthesis protein FlhF
MHLKRYEVVDMAEAISQIKRDLGPDAIILSTRTIHKRGGIFRLVDKPLLEVIAAADPRESQRPDPPGSGVSRDAGLVDPALAPPPAFSLELPPMPSATAEIEVLRQEVRLMRAELQTFQEKAPAEPTPPPDTHHLPKSLMNLHQQLITRGIASELADQLLAEVNRGRPVSVPREDVWLQDALKSAMIRQVSALEPRSAQGSSPHCMAFVGPTGVGKTTTIAKLAAVSALTERRRVALITLDTYRIAAAEQLKVYGNIIGTPVIVASDREEFSQALRQTRDFEVIFIDTAGRCHRNTEQMWELQALLSHPWPIEAHLVLSATTREEEAEEMIRQFSVIPLQSLLFTKLDESSSLGSLFNLAVRTAKPLSYLTTGQRVPEDFEVATPERIVDLCWHGFWR